MADNETAFKANTKEQVKAMASEGLSAQQIAEKLDKTPATIYNHLRNLGIATTGKRGRPRKSDSEKATATPRARPQKGAAKGKPHSAVAAAAHASNGADGELLPDLHDQVKGAIRKRQAEIAKLEKVLSTLQA